MRLMDVSFASVRPRQRRMKFLGGVPAPQHNTKVGIPTSQLSQGTRSSFLISSLTFPRVTVCILLISTTGIFNDRMTYSFHQRQKK